jgi:Acyl dehydratase
MTIQQLTCQTLTYEQIEVGMIEQLSRTVSTEMVEAYARLVGDVNPVHLDEAFAAKTIFRRRIAHGMLPAGLISAILGTRLPGPGSIYLSQELEFKRPVYLDDTIIAKVEVIEKYEQKKVKLHTWVENQAGQIVVDGQALVLVR